VTVPHETSVLRALGMLDPVHHATLALFVGSRAHLDEVAELVHLSRAELIGRTADALAALGLELGLTDPPARLELLDALSSLPAEHWL
jgi:hypothetical protein